MKIFVNEMPEKSSDCLFSKWNCEYGWFCKLFRNNEKGAYKIPYCDIKNCPYLLKLNK